MADPLLGEIKLFGGNFAPVGWMLCQGQLLSISQNTALFSIVGTFYGGNGTTTFGLPDLRSRVPVGPDTNTVVIGSEAGTENVSILNINMPTHTHPLKVNGDTNGISPTVTNTYFNGKTASGEPVTSTGSALTQLSAATVGLAGGNVPVNHMPPFLGLNYIIAVEGVYPSRN